MADPQDQSPGAEGRRASSAETGVERGPEEQPTSVSSPSFFENLPQFVIFPLVVVLIAVLIIVFFRASVEESRSVSDILTEIQTSWRKDQPAFALALRAGELEEEGKKFTAEDTRHLIRILHDTRESNLRTFLIEALGRAGEESLALEELLRSIGKKDVTDGERVNIMRGLGLSGSPRAVEPLIEEIAGARGPDRWEVRLHALISLANLAHALRGGEHDELRGTIRTTFRESLLDEWTVSWNAAITLATDFDDASGERVLHRMLEREYLGRYVKSIDDQAVWLARAVEALTSISDEGARDQIKSLENDPSAKVRNAVFKYLKHMKARNAS